MFPADRILWQRTQFEFYDLFGHGCLFKYPPNTWPDVRLSIFLKARYGAEPWFCSFGLVRGSYFRNGNLTFDYGASDFAYRKKNNLRLLISGQEKHINRSNR